MTEITAERRLDITADVVINSIQICEYCYDLTISNYR